MKKNKNAFTLVEVMIVVAIVALLAAIAIPNLVRARVTANEANAQGTLKLISNALENYAATNSKYPNSTSLLIGITPPYLATDYFSGIHFGYTYVPGITDYIYSVTAIPTSSNTGTASFTISTGGILKKN